MTSIHDDIEWDLGRSAYVPQEYVRPWDREGWGGSDVVVTPPREGAWKPNKPGFQQGQRDYQYMATEKEQRRERAVELADQARKEGIDWRERQLPREAIANRRSDPPEKVYGDWREAEIPKERKSEVGIGDFMRDQMRDKGINTSATQNVNRPTRSYRDSLKDNYNPYAVEQKDYSLEPRWGDGSLVSKHSTLEGYRKDLQYSKDTGAGIIESSQVPKWNDILGVSWGNYGIPNTIGEIPSDYQRWSPN